MSSSDKPRVRFAPSPTGYLHVGGARTALYSIGFSPAMKEDSFCCGSKTPIWSATGPSLSQGILDGLKWLGIEWDEGPFFQSQRLEMYRAAAERLLASGSAFACYCKASAYAGGDSASRGLEDQEGEGDDEGPKAQKKVACICRDLSDSERAAKEK